LPEKMIYLSLDGLLAHWCSSSIKVRVYEYVLPRVLNPNGLYLDTEKEVKGKSKNNESNRVVESLRA